MQYKLSEAVEILGRTPAVIDALVRNLPAVWSEKNEGGDTWSVYDVVGHLIHGETTDWVNRMEIILAQGEDRKFPTFERFAMFEESKGKTLNQLVDEFAAVRKKNIEILLAKNLTETQLDLKGIHPKFGEVTLRQLLSTWVAHDMGHLAQMARVIAKQYKEEVGPWVEYLRILQS
ncbi:MAG TPA: DinB family protein [Bacteroidia bacterium]|nr:DinB family protein [Bacteroidia bacterium]